MNHKGYTGSVDFSHEDRVFHGRVLGIRDMVTFEGTSVDDLEQAFRDSVNDYLEMCAEEGNEPNKPCSGVLSFRIGKGLHRRAAIEAEREGASLNTWLIKAVEQKLRRQT